jgi:hypothetical protein
MVEEGELSSNLDDSERVRELQDKVADLKAEVSAELLAHIGKRICLLPQGCGHNLYVICFTSTNYVG